jgi:hypothetical protein
MVECDSCGADVPDVWRHREFTESMTHREITWICRSCHPAVADTPGSLEGTGKVAVTDGGPEQ